MLRTNQSVASCFLISMSIRQQVKTLLEGNTDITSALTGGIHVGREIRRGDTAAAFDANGDLLPCALIKLENMVGIGNPSQWATVYLQIFLYEQQGTDAIDAVLDELPQTLDGQLLTGYREFMFENVVTDQEDPALRNANLHMVRYRTTKFRGGNY